MCEFCENKKTLIQISTDNHKTENAVLNIINSKLIFITTINRDTGFGEVIAPRSAFSYKINFCPVCGRKLGESDFIKDEKSDFDIELETAMRRKTFNSKIQKENLELLKSTLEMLDDTKTIMSSFKCKIEQELISPAISRISEKTEEENL